jgi:hypothetical protein
VPRDTHASWAKDARGVGEKLSPRAVSVLKIPFRVFSFSAGVGLFFLSLGAAARKNKATRVQCEEDAKPPVHEELVLL